METRFHVPASWSVVKAAVPASTAEGEVGAEIASEHATEKDAMMVTAHNERKAFMA